MGKGPAAGQVSADRRTLVADVEQASRTTRRLRRGTYYHTDLRSARDESVHGDRETRAASSSWLPDGGFARPHSSMLIERRSLPQDYDAAGRRARRGSAPSPAPTARRQAGGPESSLRKRRRPRRRQESPWRSHWSVVVTCHQDHRLANIRGRRTGVPRILPGRRGGIYSRIALSLKGPPRGPGPAGAGPRDTRQPPRHRPRRLLHHPQPAAVPTEVDRRDRVASSAALTVRWRMRPARRSVRVGRW
jgi:hypothetical protein